MAVFTCRFKETQLVRRKFSCLAQIKKTGFLWLNLAVHFIVCYILQIFNFGDTING